MPRVSVDIVGDADSLLRALKKSVSGFGRFDQALKASTAESRASTQARVGAVVKLDESLRSQIVAYREVAAAAAKGSREQLVAARLAERAQVSLSRSFGVTASESRALSRSSRSVERDFGRATRGALAGSGVFRGLGRSIAFASGGFLAFASIGQAFRTSIDAAKEAAVTQKQLTTQLHDSGLSFAKYRGEIDKTDLRLSALSGFTKDQLDASFTTIVRTTGNVSKALRDNATAADLARARHIGLAQAALIIAKTEAHNTTLLRRQGFQIAKNATVEQALAVVRAKIAGQARAGSTEQERFGAVLHDSEVIIGAGLLPTLNKYLAEGALWLTQMNESGKLQKDVSSAAHGVRDAIHAGAEAFSVAKGAIQTADRVTGSFKNTLEEFATVWLLLKTRTALIRWGVIESGIFRTGAAARVAGGEVATLSTRLNSLKNLGLITVGVEVAIHRKEVSGAIGNAIKDATGSSFLGSIAKKVERVAIDIANPSLGGTDIAQGIFGGKKKRPGGRPSGLDLTPAEFAAEQARLARAAKTAMATTKDAAGRPVSLAGQFNLDELKLADAQRRNQVGLQRAILADEERIVLRLRDQAKSLKDRTAFAQQAASIEDQIRSLDRKGVTAASKAAAKRKAAALKAAKAAAAFSVPLSLQVADARAQALGKSEKTILAKIKAAAEKALKSGRLGLQGQLDAWNAIASVNDQLKGAANPLGKFREANLRRLTKGLDVPPAVRKALEARLSQVGIGGHIPNTGVGAFGYQVGGSGTVVVHTQVNLDGKKVAKSVTNHQIRRNRRNSSQSRGPHAGA